MLYSGKISYTEALKLYGALQKQKQSNHAGAAAKKSEDNSDDKNKVPQ